MKRLAVFVSGGGSNFRSIHDKMLSGEIPGEVVLLVTNNTECAAADYAREHRIEVVKYPDAEMTPAMLAEKLQAANCDYIILAGYIKLVPAEVVRAFSGKTLNIHPGPLPDFGGKGYYGIRVHEAVLASGRKYSAATVHIVDEVYDRGPILAAVKVPVFEGDTPQNLASRVLKQEHRLYPAVVGALCRDEIAWEFDGSPKIEPSLKLD